MSDNIELSGGSVVAIAQLAQASALIKHIEGTPLIAVPRADGSKELVSIETAMSRPTRNKGKTFVFGAEPFVYALTRELQAGAGPVAIYHNSDASRPSIVAILNDSVANEPAWRDHRIEVVFAKTIEWNEWSKRSGQMMDQASLGEFLEDHADDIISMDNGALHELVLQFEANTKSDFSSSANLQNGNVAITFNETTQVKRGGAPIEIPRFFDLNLAVFQGGPNFKFKARFLYKARDGKLEVGFKIVRMEQYIQHSIEAMRDSILGAFTTEFQIETKEGTVCQPTPSGFIVPNFAAIAPEPATLTIRP